MSDAIKQAWLAHEETRKSLNIAVNAKYYVGQKVKARWGGKWLDAVVQWVPYQNGPAATYIYIKFPHHKESKKYEMGGGVFDSVRTGDFDGVE